MHAVGINEVLKASGIAKKTLYNHFASKEDLLIAALQWRDEQFWQWLKQQLSDAAGNRELINKLFHALEDWFNDRVDQLNSFRGCFFINAAAEYSDKNLQVCWVCKQHKQRVQQLIADSLPEHSAQLAFQLWMLKEAGIVSALVNQNRRAAINCLKHFQFE